MGARYKFTCRVRRGETGNYTIDRQYRIASRFLKKLEDTIVHPDLTGHLRRRLTPQPRAFALIHSQNRQAIRRLRADSLFRNRRGMPQALHLKHPAEVSAAD